MSKVTWRIPRAIRRQSGSKAVSQTATGREVKREQGTRVLRRDQRPLTYGQRPLEGLYILSERDEEDFK